MWAREYWNIGIFAGVYGAIAGGYFDIFAWLFGSPALLFPGYCTVVSCLWFGLGSICAYRILERLTGRPGWLGHRLRSSNWIYRLSGIRRRKVIIRAAIRIVLTLLAIMPLCIAGYMPSHQVHGEDMERLMSELYTPELAAQMFSFRDVPRFGLLGTTLVLYGYSIVTPFLGAGLLWSVLARAGGWLVPGDEAQKHASR